MGVIKNSLIIVSLFLSVINTGQSISSKNVIKQRDADDAEVSEVSFTYSLWIGTEINECYSLNMVAPRNESFYHVMQMAAIEDSRFEFEASEWPFGHYVHTIAGVQEYPDDHYYWLLYRLPEHPDPANPPGEEFMSPVGVDGLLVQDGEHYLFWYQKFSIHE